MLDAAEKTFDVKEQDRLLGKLHEVIVDDGVVRGIRGHGADGVAVTELAQVVIGADGRSSRVARAVRPQEYLNKPVLQQGFYTYFRDLPVSGFEIYIRDRWFERDERSRHPHDIQLWAAERQGRLDDLVLGLRHHGTC